MITRRLSPAGLMLLGLTFFTALLSLTIPLYMMQMYERVLSSQSLSSLGWLTVIAVSALAVFAVLDFIRHRILHVLAAWLAARIGVDVIEGVVKRGAALTGDPGRGLRDVEEVRSFMGGSTIIALCDLFWSPLFFLILFMIHPAYGIGAVTGALMLVGLAVINELVTHRPLLLANERAQKANGQVALALRNAEAIEAMGLMPHVLRRWVGMNKAAQEALDAGATRAISITAVSRGFRIFVLMAIIVTGALLVLADGTAPGHIVAAVIIVGRAIGPFEHLIDQWRQCLFAWAAAGRIRDVLSAADHSPAALRFSPPRGALDVEAVTFAPAGAQRPVLHDVSFRVEPGEVIALTGPSGAGKSTLARLIVGVARPTAGSIRLSGHDIHRWDREDLGRSLGYLPQNVGLFDVSVRDNISRLSPADPLDVVAAARRVDVHEMIGHLPLGYDTPVGDGGFVLTGGQRQRVGLARAFFGNPHLIVLDEPDANLDQAGETALIEAVLDAKNAGSIVVVASHRRAIVNIADKLLILRDGAVEHFGERQQVIAALRGPRTGHISALRLAGSDDGARE